VRAQGDDGAELNAEFSVVADGLHLSLVLDSAGGRTAGERPRNHEYVSALSLLLSRLRDRQAMVLSAMVVSKRTAALPEHARSLLPDPVDLADVSDIEQLRLRITRAQGKVGLPATASKEGNNRKRIALRLAVPGYGPTDAARLEEDLAVPAKSAQDSASVRRTVTSTDLVAAVTGLTLHNHLGRPSLHKPLTLLWMIGRVATGGTRLVAWPEFRHAVGAILAEFGPDHSRNTPEYPFWHLASSPALWEVHGVADVPKASADAAFAGLPRPAAELMRDESVRTNVVNVLLESHLSDVIDRDALLDRVGLGRTQPALPKAHELLRTLIGVEIHTVHGKPNLILAVRGDQAVVRTQRSPDGQPVGIGEVQKGLDKLAAQGSVRISVEELGHRSSFVGAVLAALPDARFVDNPTRVVIREVRSSQLAKDPSFGGLDGTAEVKVRREQAQLRTMLAGKRQRARCALCGHEFPMELLVAAHVKKRSVCTDAERLDLSNVAMLACSLGCDALYEQGWIAVDNSGLIRTVLLDELSDDNFRDRLARLAGLRCAAHHEASEPYFSWHRSTVYRGNS
jgi:hypothetical protein